jgi:hypothetical protein
VIWEIILRDFWGVKKQAPQLLFRAMFLTWKDWIVNFSNLAPVGRETSCGSSRLENRAAIHQQKNFGQ